MYLKLYIIVDVHVQAKLSIYFKIGMKPLKPQTQTGNVSMSRLRFALNWVKFVRGNGVSGWSWSKSQVVPKFIMIIIIIQCFVV
jgi:hypothetical protein